MSQVNNKQIEIDRNINNLVNLCNRDSHINERGNTVLHGSIDAHTRKLEAEYLQGRFGWERVPNACKGAYYGAWFNDQLQACVDTAEGDLNVCICDDDDTWEEEKKALFACYAHDIYTAI